MSFECLWDNYPIEKKNENVNNYRLTYKEFYNEQIHTVKLALKGSDMKRNTLWSFYNYSLRWPIHV